MAQIKKSTQKSTRSTRRSRQLDNSFGALLVHKTLCRRPKYGYMLSAADLEKLAPHYQLLLQPDDAFNVIGSKAQLGAVLDGYRDNDRKGVLSLVLHVAPLHWSTMVVHGRELYFADSLNQKLLSEYDEAVTERPELHLNNYSWEQQNDGHNCGFWALMNAEAIRRQIHNYGPSSSCFPCVLPSVSSRWQSSFFAALRRDMAKKVQEHDRDGREVVQEEDESSNSSSESVYSVEAVQRGRPKVSKKAPMEPRPADKQTQKKARTTANLRETEQSIDSSSNSVVIGAKSKKRKNLLEDEVDDKPRKKKNVQVGTETKSSEKDVAGSDQKCLVCEKTFQTPRQLLDHKRCHQPLNLKCNFCDYRTNRQGNLNAHIKRKHGDFNSFLRYLERQRTTK